MKKMRHITKISKTKKQNLHQAFQKSKNPREKIRYQAVWLLSKNYSKKEVAKITGASTSSLRKWITLYNQKSLRGLKDKY